jgi:outer membrane immunogenic protein
MASHEFRDREATMLRVIGGGRSGLKNFAACKRRVMAALAGLLAVTNFAWAADMSLPMSPSMAPPYAPVPYSWSGLYLGVNAGYVSTKVSETFAGGVIDSAGVSIPGGIGGAQLGYNYQIGGMVLGFETDFDGSMGTRSINGAITSGTARIPWVATFRGRVGVAFDRVLVYATAGGAATQLFANVNTTIGSAQTTQTHGGWTAGGGLEYGINTYLSARVEYLYFDTGSINVASIGATPPPPMTTVTGRMQASMMRAGLNLRLPVGD